MYSINSPTKCGNKVSLNFQLWTMITIIYSQKGYFTSHWNYWTISDSDSMLYPLNTLSPRKDKKMDEWIDLNYTYVYCGLNHFCHHNKQSLFLIYITVAAATRNPSNLFVCLPELRILVHLSLDISTSNIPLCYQSGSQSPICWLAAFINV